MRRIPVFAMAALFLAASFVSAQPPDTLWTQIFGGSTFDQCRSVQQTNDGGFILGGITDSFGAGDYDMHLVKTDSLGNQEWQQTFGAGEEEMGWSVQQIDDGYILGGFTVSFGAGNKDMYLVKTDVNGDMLWSQTFGDYNNNQCWSVQQTTDGGYILGGETFQPGTAQNMYLVKTDPLGNLEWEQVYGDISVDVCESVQQTTDGGYILGGWSYSIPTSHDMYLVKTNSLGILEWQQTYGGSEIDRCYSVQQTSDGGYILGGHTWSFGAGGIDMYLVKTDYLGNMQWERTFGGSGDEYCYSLQQSVDGGYILGGYTTSYGAGSHDMYLVKTDNLGSPEWEQTFGGDSYEDCYSVRQTSDSGYVLAGETQSFGVGGHDIYLVRVEAGGSPPVISVTLTPVNPPIVIPASGGSFDYSIEIGNPEVMHLIFDGWIMVTLPNASQYGPVKGPINFTLPAGATIVRFPTQNVPPHAPSGDYTCAAYMGVYPDIVWGSDSFPFEKLETGDGVPVNGWTNSGRGFDAWLFEPAVEVPYKFGMLGNYPNPFNPITTISFILPAAGKVNLSIFDISGRLVTTLSNGWRDAGVHQVTCDGSHLASGIYIYRLDAADFTASGKMVLMK